MDRSIDVQLRAVNEAVRTNPSCVSLLHPPTALPDVRQQRNITKITSSVESREFLKPIILYQTRWISQTCIPAQNTPLELHVSPRTSDYLCFGSSDSSIVQSEISCSYCSEDSTKSIYVARYRCAVSTFLFSLISYRRCDILR